MPRPGAGRSDAALVEITDTVGLVGRPQGLRIAVRPELAYPKDLKSSRKHHNEIRPHLAQPDDV
ncbi:hypothetical protein ACWECR_04750 [Streptomyces sp. NPDC005056]